MSNRGRSTFVDSQTKINAAASQVILDEEYIVRLVRQVVTVSVEMVQLIDELSKVVKMEDWMNFSLLEN